MSRCPRRVSKAFAGLTLLVASAAHVQFAHADAVAEKKAVRAPAASSVGSVPSPSAVTPTQEPPAEAQEHFLRAKELYQAGSYREAIVELERARALDPDAKDLVFNLAVVEEKLGRFDAAIDHFRRYCTLPSVTDTERSKAEVAIRRIEGARREVQSANKPTSFISKDSGRANTHLAPLGASNSGAPRGRIDTATVTAASLALAALGTGTGLAIYATATKPSDNAYVTGRDGSYADLDRATQNAHTAAVWADVAFAVGAVSTLIAGLLYFGRARDVEEHSLALNEQRRGDASGDPTRSNRLSPLATATVVPTVRTNGAAVALGGTF